MNSREESMALVAACLEGDPSAQRRLVRSYHRTVRQAVSFLAVARSNRVSRADIDDAVQQCFLSFFANDASVLRAWQGTASLRTYLSRIAERVARRHFQRVLRRGGRFRLDLDQPSESGESRLDRLEVDQDVVSTDEALMHEEERDRLRGIILERLSEKGRAYYDYLFVREMDVGAIAELEETNPNNVYQWKNRISKLALEVLDEAGYRP